VGRGALAGLTAIREDWEDWEDYGHLPPYAKISRNNHQGVTPYITLPKLPNVAFDTRTEGTRHIERRRPNIIGELSAAAI
jgi:hypothetical protein